MFYTITVYSKFSKYPENPYLGYLCMWSYFTLQNVEGHDAE